MLKCKTSRFEWSECAGVSGEAVIRRRWTLVSVSSALRSQRVDESGCVVGVSCEWPSGRTQRIRRLADRSIITRRPFDSPVDRVLPPRRFSLIDARPSRVGHSSDVSWQPACSRVRMASSDERAEPDRMGWKRAAGPECQPVDTNRIKSSCYHSKHRHTLGSRHSAATMPAARTTTTSSERNSGRPRSVASQTVVSMRSLVPVRRIPQQSSHRHNIETVHND